MIAIFFVVLARSVRRPELQTWVNAWLANLLALLVTSILWVGQPTSEAAYVAIRMGYFFSKTMFVALPALGAWRVVRPRLGARADREIILNDFKEINDSLGHHVGDECLKRFANQGFVPVAGFNPMLYMMKA